MLCRILGPPGPKSPVTATPFPRGRSLVLFAVALGAAATLLRVAFPVALPA